MKIKFHILAWIIAVMVIALTGCTGPYGEPNNTASGALIGGGAGAATGAAIGGSSHGGEDALIGAAAGAIVGGAIGNSMDQEQKARLRQQAPQTYVRVDQGQQLSPADIKAMAQAGVSDDVIITQIRNSHTIFRLSSADVIDLHNAGVKDTVIDYMINTQSSAAPVQPGAMVVAQPPPAMPAPVAAVPAPGPGYVWISGDWIWNGGWIWVGGHWGYPPYPHAVWVGGTWYHGPHGWYHHPGYWRR